MGPAPDPAAVAGAGLDGTGSTADPSGVTCLCTNGGAVLAAMRRASEVLEELREDQLGLQAPLRRCIQARGR